MDCEEACLWLKGGPREIKREEITALGLLPGGDIDRLGVCLQQSNTAANCEQRNLLHKMAEFIAERAHMTSAMAAAALTWLSHAGLPANHRIAPRERTILAAPGHCYCAALSWPGTCHEENTYPDRSGKRARRTAPLRSAAVRGDTS